MTDEHMCLTIFSDKDFIAPDTNIAWKVITYLDGKWQTPIRGYLVNVKSGKLTAEGQFGSLADLNSREVNAGAIHCYKTKELAFLYSATSDFVLKVKGKHHIANNATQIAFAEIEWEPQKWWWIQTKILWNKFWHK